VEPVAKVFLKKAEYDYATLRPSIFELLDKLAGDRIGHQSRVLIKAEPACACRT
jgi:hypothetical protein